MPMRELGEELLEFVDDVVDELGSRDALEPIQRSCAKARAPSGSCAVYAETGDLRAVVRQIVAETRGETLSQAT